VLRTLIGVFQIALGIAAGLVFLAIFVRLMMNVGTGLPHGSPGALLIILVIGTFCLRTICAPIVWALIQAGQRTIQGGQAKDYGTRRARLRSRGNEIHVP
jgi:hypothetical protein